MCCKLQPLPASHCINRNELYTILFTQLLVDFLIYYGISEEGTTMAIVHFYFIIKPPLHLAYSTSTTTRSHIVVVPQNVFRHVITWIPLMHGSMCLLIQCCLVHDIRVMYLCGTRYIKSHGFYDKHTSTLKVKL